MGDISKNTNNFLRNTSNYLKIWKTLCYFLILINFPLKLSDSCLNIQQNLLKESFQNWGASYSIEFDIVVNKLPSSQWTNVFRFTATNGNFGSHGDRIPALFVNNNGFFSFRTSLSNQGDFESNINFVIGEPYHVIIQHFNDSGQYFVNFNMDNCQNK